MAALATVHIDEAVHTTVAFDIGRARAHALSSPTTRQLAPSGIFVVSLNSNDSVLSIGGWWRLTAEFAGREYEGPQNSTTQRWK